MGKKEKGYIDWKVSRVRKILLLALTLISAIALAIVVKYVFDTKAKEEQALIQKQIEISSQHEAERAASETSLASEEETDLLNSSAYQKLKNGAELKLLILGDSIAYSMANPLADKLSTDYGSEIMLDNMALSGANGSYSTYVQTALLDDGTEYDLAIICSGYCDGKESYSRYIELSVRELIKKLPNCSIISVAQSDSDYNAWKSDELKALSVHYGIPMADIYTPFQADRYAYVADDGVSLNENGEELYISTLSELISKLIDDDTGKPDYESTPINSDLEDAELRYIARNDFKRVNDTTFSIDTEIAGVLGIDYCYKSDDFRAQIYLDGALCYAPVADKYIEEATRHILMVQDYAVANNDVSVIFPTVESADAFCGLVLEK